MKLICLIAYSRYMLLCVIKKKKEKKKKQKKKHFHTLSLNFDQTVRVSFCNSSHCIEFCVKTRLKSYSFLLFFFYPYLIIDKLLNSHSNQLEIRSKTLERQAHGQIHISQGVFSLSFFFYLFLLLLVFNSNIFGGVGHQQHNLRENSRVQIFITWTNFNLKFTFVGPSIISLYFESNHLISTI